MPPDRANPIERAMRPVKLSRKNSLFAERASEIRRLHMLAHLEFLDRNAVTIRAAGPLHDGAAGQAAGGLWLVEADTTEAVRMLTQEDPFWLTGLRRSIRVLEWRQVFVDGRRQS
jgi:hypothetical protein